METIKTEADSVKPAKDTTARLVCYNIGVELTIKLKKLVD